MFPLLKINMGKMELVLLVPVVVTLDVELDEELTFTETEGAVLFVTVVLESLTQVVKMIVLIYS